MKSKLATLGFVLILSALIFSGCGPTTAQPSESSTATPSAGPHINLVEQAGLTSTVKIEILELDLASAAATGVQYVHRLTIAKPQVIDQIVAALDMDLTLGPRARCPTAYSLQFHLANGTVQAFGYACDPENPITLRGEQGFWRGQDGKPSAEFNMLIQEQLAYGGTLSVSELLENPVYDTEVRIHGEVSLLGELFCPCFELTSGGKEVQIWYGLMVEDDGTERPAVSVEGIENGDQVVVTGQLKTAGAHRSLNDFWASNIGSSTAAAGEYCSDKDTGAKLSYQEAVEIAQESECLEQGQLKETRFCNEDTGTWWIDLDIDKPGCSPACVVNVSNRTAETNWRCTGVIPPTTTAAPVTRYEVTVHFNTSVTQDDIDEAGALLRAYDKDLEFLIMESWPPLGRAFLEAKVPLFCMTVKSELEAKTYVDEVVCESAAPAPPDAPPPTIAPNLDVILEGGLQVSIRAGDRYPLDPMDLVAVEGIEVPPCAAFVFLFSWQTIDPYPPDGLDLRLYSTRMGHTGDVGRGPSGEGTAGCGLFEIVNHSSVQVTLKLRYVIATVE